eukprot:458388-Lingulodinium_polyedra.AAC.1
MSKGTVAMRGMIERICSPNLGAKGCIVNKVDSVQTAACVNESRGGLRLATIPRSFRRGHHFR